MNDLVDRLYRAIHGRSPDPNEVEAFMEDFVSAFERPMDMVGAGGNRYLLESFWVISPGPDGSVERLVGESEPQ